MSKFFKKYYKYTPLGWWTKGYKKLGWKAPDKLMNKYLDSHSDGEIALQIGLGLVGAGSTSGLTSGATGIGSFLNGLFGGSKKSKKLATEDESDYWDYLEENDIDIDGITGGQVTGKSGKDLKQILASIGKTTGITDIKGLLEAALGVTSAINAYNVQNHLTGNQIESNEWSAEQASLAYDRQKEFYEDYLSAPAQVRQYKEAGLNPMMLAGGAAGSTAPSVPQASAPSAPSTNFSDVLTSMLSYKIKSRELDIKEQELPSKIAANEANARKGNTWSDYHGMDVSSLVKYREANTNLTLEKINTEQGKQRLQEAQINESEARAALTIQKAIDQQIANMYGDQYYANRNSLQQAEVSLKQAETAKNWQEVQNLKMQIQVMGAQIREMDANVGLAVAQTKNLGAEFEILGIEKVMKQFDQEHQKGNLNWQRAGQVVGMVGDMASAVGQVVGGFATATAAGVFKAAKGQIMSAPSYAGQQSVITSPTGSTIQYDSNGNAHYK